MTSLTYYPYARIYRKVGNIAADSFPSSRLAFYFLALHELDRVLVGKDDHDGESMRSPSTKSSLSTNGHRHSKLDDIVRSLSSVVNQQQENARRILDESSVLLTDDEQQVNDEQQQPIRLPPTTQESIKVVLDRLNALVDRGNAIYDRVESILSEL